jgi:palmitoyltransferase ZDHHC1/11
VIEPFRLEINDCRIVQIASVVLLYVWCAATNPGDPGIFSSTKDSRLDIDEKHSHITSEHGIGNGGKPLSEDFSAVDNSERLSSMLRSKDSSSRSRFSKMLCLICAPFSCLCKRCFHSVNQPSGPNLSEEGMFFCSLCEAEV